jgi:hypothetical protein
MSTRTLKKYARQIIELSEVDFVADSTDARRRMIRSQFYAQMILAELTPDQKRKPATVAV